jgi:hypothetical protein
MTNSENFPTISEVIRKLSPLKGLTFSEIKRLSGVEFTSKLGHKGCVGHFVEGLAGLPKSNERLDFKKEGGELKTKVYHKGCELGACVVGHINELAAEMIEQDVSLEESIIGQKMFKTVLVTVCSNRKGGGPAGAGWESFTLETVDNHPLLEMPEWEGIVEDWEYLKEYTRHASLSRGFVSSSAKGPNDYLCFNPCSASFRYNGRALRKSGGGLQLALGATLMRRITKFT